MPKAVQLFAYGAPDQIHIVDVPNLEPQVGQVIVRVLTAGTNPGEILIREGKLKDTFPKVFPFGQGTDFAGIVDSVGTGVTDVKAGDEVIGWTYNRDSQADYIAAEPGHLIPKPAPLDWFRAGSLFTVASTAFAAVRAVSLGPGDIVAVSNAAGGVGSLALQLARRVGARVLGIAGDASKSFVESVGAEHVAHGDGLADRLRKLAPSGIDAFIDLFGDQYVDLAIELGVKRERIDTTIGFVAAQKHGTKTDASAEAADQKIIAEVAHLVAWGEMLSKRLLRTVLRATSPFTMMKAPCPLS